MIAGALVVAILSTSPTPVGEKQPLQQKLDLGRDGGTRVKRLTSEETRVVLAPEATTAELMAALKEHLKAKTPDAKSCRIAINFRASGQEHLTFGVEGTTWKGAVNCGAFDETRKPSVRIALADKDNKVVAIFHKFPPWGTEAKDEPQTVYGAAGGSVRKLRELELKEENRSTTVLEIPLR